MVSSSRLRSWGSRAPHPRYPASCPTSSSWRSATPKTPRYRAISSGPSRGCCLHLSPQSARFPCRRRSAAPRYKAAAPRGAFSYRFDDLRYRALTYVGFSCKYTHQDTPHTRPTSKLVRKSSARPGRAIPRPQLEPKSLSPHAKFVNRPADNRPMPRICPQSDGPPDVIQRGPFAFRTIIRIEYAGRYR